MIVGVVCVGFVGVFGLLVWWGFGLFVVWFVGGGVCMWGIDCVFVVFCGCGVGGFVGCFLVWGLCVGGGDLGWLVGGV